MKKHIKTEKVLDYDNRFIVTTEHCVNDNARIAVISSYAEWDEKIDIKVKKGWKLDKCILGSADFDNGIIHTKMSNVDTFVIVIKK